jgi:predicted O-methyltransferase YrrM
MPSAQAAANFADASLDAVIIDADHHYESVRDDLAAWLPKAKRGGIVAGDDYRNPTWPGVAKAVDEALGNVEFIAPMGFFWRKP